MRDEEFNDDDVDAGDIGAGHTVTAFYELIPSGHLDLASLPRPDALKYQPQPVYEPTYNDELLTAKIRYKLPTENESSLISIPVSAASVRKAGTESVDFRFAASVAGFGMLLRDSPYKGTTTYASVIDLAQGAIGKDEFGYRTKFVEMVGKAAGIKR
jgi:Ca-activated chloride channel family protein